MARKESIDDLYPGSAFLNSQDVSGTVEAVIEGVSVETLRNGGKKLTLAFEKNAGLPTDKDGNTKRLALNKTNVDYMRENHGDDYDEWTGKTVKLSSVPTQFQGNTVKGLRLVD